MKSSIKNIGLIVFSFFLLLMIAWRVEQKPTIYLIGDSTVDDGSGNNGLWGWGKFFPQFFDSSKIAIRNYAQGGTSARTFQTNGIWDKRINKRGMWDTVYSKIKKGDYLIIQFGLNDQGKIDDTARARGTLVGIGNDSVNIYNAVTKQNETVHSFGWYMRKFIQQAKAKGATVIVCSSIPKNDWKDGKLVRGELGFAKWALDVAKEEKVYSIDLNSMVADAYDAEGEAAVTEKYHIPKDHVHTVSQGAILNASILTIGIKKIPKCDLKDYLLSK
jgi:lysophospholipase L1-like esterase